MFVKLYSNGIAANTRVYNVESQQKISIPVCKDHIADVLSSLTIIGNVKLTSPPSYNSLNSDCSLSINTKDALFDLICRVNGSRVKISTSNSKIFGTDYLVGRILGTNVELSKLNDITLSRKCVSILLNDSHKISNIPLDEIKDIQFLDSVVIEEVDKLLNKNFNLIKPNSSFINFEVIGNGKVNVNYTLPAPVWKPTYRLIEENGKFKLIGYAIIDNNSEEDWEDAIISVIAGGNPNTFSTDLADAKIPLRHHVNVVKDHIDIPLEASTAIKRARTCAKPENLSMSTLNEMQHYDTNSEICESLIEDVVSQDIEDFSVFTYNEKVTIKSKTSVIIPIISIDLDENTKKILYCISNNMSIRKAIIFKNNTNNALSRGVCTVSVNGSYAGNCIIPSTSKNQTSIINYAIDSLVKIYKTGNKVYDKEFSIAASKDILYIKRNNIHETRYTIDVNSTEPTVFIFDYIKKNINSKVTNTLENVKEYDIPNGVRYEVKLTENINFMIKESETSLVETKKTTDELIRLIGMDTLIKPLITMKNEIESFEEDLNNLTNSINTNLSTIKQIKSNLEIDIDDITKNEWLASLKTLMKENEKLITNKKEIEIKIKSLNNQVRDFLNNLIFEERDI